jgi:hypothetical protein
MSSPEQPPTVAATLTSPEQWSQNPADTFLYDATQFEAATAMLAKSVAVLPDVPEGAVVVEDEHVRPWPYSRGFLLSRALVSIGYDVGFARDFLAPAYNRKDTVMYVGEQDRKITKHFNFGKVSANRETGHYAYFSLLNSILYGGIAMHHTAFVDGEFQQEMALEWFAELGERLPRLHQRAFMTSHLIGEGLKHDRKAVLVEYHPDKIPSIIPLIRRGATIRDNLRKQAGLYHELKEAGVSSFSADELSELALRAIKWQDLGRITDREAHTTPL